MNSYCGYCGCFNVTCFPFYFNFMFYVPVTAGNVLICNTPRVAENSNFCHIVVLDKVNFLQPLMLTEAAFLSLLAHPHLHYVVLFVY